VIDPALESRARFTNMVAEALALIETSDPTRFRRVQSRIRTIVNTVGIIGSAYQALLRVCMVNPQNFGYQGARTGSVEFLASTLVHDATFGHLLSKGILRTSANYDRFDRICCREAQRFMQRLGLTKTPWDPEHLSRLGRMQTLTAGLKEFASSERDAKSDDG